MPTVSTNNGKFLLALNAHPKIGSQTIKKVLAAFPDLEKMWQRAEPEILRNFEPKIADLVIEARSQFDPERELERLKKYDIGYITMSDKDYPDLLNEVHDCPAVLYVKGNIAALKMPSIAIVGSRRYTSYGKRVARQLAASCVEAGLSVVSGLALGIDGEAHRAVVENGGITVGVLACGVDKIYPGSHTELAREIIKSGGAIISEQPPGTEAFKQNFPARNRIIAGLSLGTLVIEAAEKSGALITAYCALEYNREVLAVPGNIDSEFSKGCNLLIQKGAKLVAKIEDVLEEFNLEARKVESRVKAMAPLTEDEDRIITLLGSGERHVDELVSETRVNIIALNSALTTLEMKGMIENVGGGRYRKIC